MKNEHLIPDLIKDIVEKYKKAKMVNERLSLEDRINAIREYLDESITKAAKQNIFRKK